MIKVLRPDHVLIKEKDGKIILKNTNFDEITYKLRPLHGFLLALYDGSNSESEIKEIMKTILDKDELGISNFMISFLKKYGRFLLPIEKAEKIFKKPWKDYDAKEFLVREKEEISADKRNPAPLYIALYLTNNCIRQCQYCYAKAKPSKSIEHNSLTTDEIKNIVKEAFMLGVEELLLTGGEPLLREDIYAIINYANSLNIKVKFLTKGRLKIDELKLMDPSLVTLGLSMDSHIPEIANELVGSNGFYDDMKGNINDLKSIKFPYCISMVVTKKNKETIKETIQFFIDNEASFVDMGHYNCDNPVDLKESLFVSEEEKKILEVEVNDFKKSNNLENRVSSLPHKLEIKDLCGLECAIGRTKLTIRFDGNYVYCEHLANADDINLGNINSKSILEVWNSEELENYMKPNRELYKESLCYHCGNFDECTGKNSCIYISKNQHGVYFKPIREVEHVCINR